MVSDRAFVTQARNASKDNTSKNDSKIINRKGEKIDSTFLAGNVKERKKAEKRLRQLKKEGFEARIQSETRITGKTPSRLVIFKKSKK